MGNKVAILGGGVAGMTAAHELIKRGFEGKTSKICRWEGKKR
jgi:uncharacterized protein with NAD-binding domain and iron-sulfur cluster